MSVVASSLAVYDGVSWSLSAVKPVDLNCLVVAGTSGPQARGDYLIAAQMRVDLTPDGMRATTNHGAQMDGHFDHAGERWDMRVPSSMVDLGLWPEIEDLLSLVLTTGWRRAQWVPLHAAGLTDGRRGVLVCATSGGGKTTFMMAMVRAGWRSLGDDKLLLQTAGSEIAGRCP